MSTLTSLRSTARDLFIKIDPNAKVRSNDVIDSLINMGYVQVQTDGNNERREQQTESTFSTVVGQQTYSLSTYAPSFLKITAVIYNETPLNKIFREDILRSSSVTNSGSPIGYYIYGANIGLYPIPSAVDTVTALYCKSLPTITTSQDSLLPSDFDRAICEYAAYMACNSVEKTDKARMFLWDYTLAMSMLSSRYKMDDSTYTRSTARNTWYQSPRAFYPY